MNLTPCTCNVNFGAISTLPEVNYSIKNACHHETEGKHIESPSYSQHFKYRNIIQGIWDCSPRQSNLKTGSFQKLTSITPNYLLGADCSFSLGLDVHMMIFKWWNQLGTIFSFVQLQQENPGFDFSGDALFLMLQHFFWYII